ncbi:MAG TPA: hypothetical protein VGP76_22955 [Planctomycetaceae bacterium]|nr:hypothetical protein [Planctomycetaceae bacterium]
MKKLTAMLLTLCFTLMIVGCGEETKTKTTKEGPGGKTSTTVETKTSK